MVKMGLSSIPAAFTLILWLSNGSKLEFSITPAAKVVKRSAVLLTLLDGRTKHLTVNKVYGPSRSINKVYGPSISPWTGKVASV